MESAFLTFVNDSGLPLSESQTLLAVSGGVDSMVMADLFRRNSFPFSIAHCNFGLRGDESDEDEKFVSQWAKRYAIPLHVRRFSTQADADRRGISIQMAARDLRYDWFRELRTTLTYDYVATAHHANDAIETLLLNVIRGTGLPGLLGISPVKDYLIRPLLSCSKSEILAFAQEEGIVWREDGSNSSDQYRRNLIRHRVLPVLQEINPSLEKTYQMTSERLRAASHLHDLYLDQWKKNVAQWQGTTLHISITAIQVAKEPAYQLNYLLEDFNFSYAQTRQIVASLQAISGKQFFSATHILTKDRTELLVSPIEASDRQPPIQVLEHDTEAIVPGLMHLIFSKYSVPSSPQSISNAPAIAYFDKQKVTFPLTIRPWQTGDRFYPFGMQGKRKRVSDLLIDRKVPVSKKKACYVLVDQTDQLMWVIGLRTDDRFSVRTTTTHVLSVEMVLYTN